VSILLALAVLSNSIAFAAGPPKPVNPVKLKQTLMTRGIGTGFKVRELNGTNITGILTAIHDETFELTPRGTTQSFSIPYAQVAAARGEGSGAGHVAASVGKSLAIGAGVFAGLIIVVALVALHGG
jgi:hypothetical protein